MPLLQRFTRRQRIGLLTSCAAGIVVVGVLAASGAFRNPPDVQFARAIADIEKGELDGVPARIRQIEKHPEYSTHARLLKGMLALCRGQPDAALRRLNPIPDEGALRPRFLLYSGQACHLLNRSREAELILRELLRVEPENEEGLRWLGVVYYDLGAFDLAMPHLKKLSSVRPDDFRADRLIALMYHDMEREGEAIPHYREALKRGPPAGLRDEIVTEMAEVLVVSRQYEEARKLLADAEPIAANLVLRAQCEWSLGGDEAAREFLAQARAAGSEDQRLSLLEAEILTSGRRLAEAAKALQAGVEQHPYDHELRYRLALALRDLGKAEESEAQLSRWRELNGLAKQLHELNNDAIARPYDAAVRWKLAEVCERVGKAELAEMWRKAAAACRPPDAAPASDRLPDPSNAARAPKSG